MSSEVWLGIWLLALLAGGLFSAISQSLRDLSRPKLDQFLGKTGRPGLRARIDAILEDPEEHAAALAMPRIGANLIVVIGMVMWIKNVAKVEELSWREASLSVLISTLLIWVVGSVVPVAVSRHAAEITTIAWSGLIRAVTIVLRPLTPLSRLVDVTVRRLAGRAHVDDAEEAQEEILSAVEEARHEGQVDETERDMIEAVVRFRETNVGQIMTPRTEVEAIPVTTNLGEVTHFIRRGGHSRIPVYEGDLDHVLGVFYIKDLMRWLAGERSGKGGGTFDLRALLRPAVFVPETKTVRELLTELLAKRIHIAIVADEYGGTAGLVTIEDIVEEVFGDIQDEYEPIEDEIGEVKLDEAMKAAEIDARAYVEDVNDALKPLGVEIPESEDYDTVGGFVTVTLGRIPLAGESMQKDGLVLTVLEAEPTRVTRVRVEATAAPAASTDEALAAERRAEPNAGR